MMKKTIFALLGLAVVLALASPPKAQAGVVIGVGVGPVFVPRPAYGHGYVAVHARPGYAYPYGYAPGYARPYYAPRAYGYYDHYDRDRYWDHRDWDRGDRGRRDRDDRGWRDRR
jgi:hypothetical protein